ncbi:ATP-NAD kinase-like domain-containing protein [Powellomyces hirtus]|nr:ATP-NAD kinase-like domain-containing protein [Powellomyces hirtus]
MVPTVDHALPNVPIEMETVPVLFSAAKGTLTKTVQPYIVDSGVSKDEAGYASTRQPRQPPTPRVSNESQKQQSPEVAPLQQHQNEVYQQQPAAHPPRQVTEVSAKLRRSGEVFCGEAVRHALKSNKRSSGSSTTSLHHQFKNPADLIIVPTVFVFIFVNPNSGPRQGASLLDLDIYGFRLRSRPEVQVTISNLMDVDDRQKGLRYFQAMQETDRIDIQQLHVWSAGGDGTFMWVLEELMGIKADLHDPRLTFCAIPFGTGNDLSQVMGWGRSIVGDPAGDHMHRLDKIIRERISGEKARLDIWEIEVETNEGGWVQKAAKPDSPSARKETHLKRKMSNYSSLGVQGFVGVGFEPHRHRSRFANVFEYALQSARIVLRGIPRLNTYAQSLEWKGRQIVTNERLAHLTRPESDRDATAIKAGKPRSHRQRQAVEVVVQNIPGLWGRHVDMWGEAQMSPSVVSSPEGPTDIANWTPNKANDGKLEVFTIANEASYVRKFLGFIGGRKSLSRIGQFPDELRINLIPDKEAALMVDGEFYKLQNCKSITWKLLIQITVMGPDEERSRMVRDSKDYFKQQKAEADVSVSSL